ncbi:MAG: tRNA (N6-isopentenyl adenosine(37)-C2)-methylthiotransferase MiaB [Oscillospiraceae bacterium]|jgi:tRNA-2-methylthio-N6-dimethylallyladenosine synthase|nr:tRNA (N6-isopentenyl adenosine(37)-C2)-methylthiotransferase MiaB [Oscillospiraceae bacterium]
MEDWEVSATAIQRLVAGRTYYVDTYGCQQNEADSATIRGLLERCGYVAAASRDIADVVVINTCSVREHAEAKVFGVIGSLVPIKRERPDMIVAVCGCMAQREGAADRLRESYRHVDLVFGTHAVDKLPTLLLEVVQSRGRVFDVESSDGAISEGLPSVRDGSVKAFLSVMYGCDNFCSYCVVPYVRGRERSRMPEPILRDARELLDSGVRDITLLGQNVNSYGKKLDVAITFPELLRRFDAFPDEFRLRFMTSHPKDAGDALFRAMAESKHAARCLHLPFQSGSSRVLNMMNRRYTREQYLALIARARELMPDIVLTSDVIVGFPGETLEDFEETMSLIDEVRFDALFTFIYSPRPGAPSYLTENNTPPDEIQRRFERLVNRQNDISEEIHAGYIGKTVRVLIDGDGTARTDGNRLVKLTVDSGQWTVGDAARGLVGEFRDVRITGANRWSLTGELTDSR